MTSRLLLAWPLLAAAPAVAQDVGALQPRNAQLLVPPAASLPDTLLIQRLSCRLQGIRIEHQEQVPVLPPVQELLRRVAGVQATPFSGRPGAPQVVRIRGAASLAGNPQPLYVVDGVPAFQHLRTEPSIVPAFLAAANNIDANQLLSVPTEDIESVTVLKGALETAQYGSQGQNGVLLIRTHRGRAGQPPRLHYAGYGGVQQVRRRYALLDARQFAELANEADARYNRAPRYSPAQVAAFGPGTDWQAQVLRPAVVFGHHLGLDGGFARGPRYYAGADYLHHDGVVLNSRLRRFGLRLNAEQQVGKLTVEGGLGLSQVTEVRPTDRAVVDALFALPTLDVRDAQGNYVSNNNFPNPVQLAREEYRQPQQRRLLGRLALRYALPGGFSAELRGSLERDELKLDQFRAAVPIISIPSGRTLKYTDHYRTWQLAPALRFERVFGAQHAVTAAAEVLRQRTRNESDIKASAPGSLGLDQNFGFVTTDLQYGLLTGSYTYAGRYEVRGSLRADDRILAGEDRRWLPGAQVTWHAGQEAFMANSRVISKLDVYAGRGVTANVGNAANGNFLPVLLALGPGSVPQFLDLDERTTQTEGGLCLALWQGKLQFEVAAYERRTTGVPSLIVFRPDNAAKYHIRNRGLEAGISSTWQTDRLSGGSSIVAAYNQNRYSSQAVLPIQYTRADHLNVSGQPLGSFHGLGFDGIDPATGELRFTDLNRDGRLDQLDLQSLGSGLPRLSLNYTQSLRLGRFGLNAQIDGLAGYQQLNTSLSALESPTGQYNASARVQQRWRPGQPSATIPRAGTSAPSGTPSYTLQSGNHLRLTSLQVDFRLWEKEARRISLWVAAHNLFVASKYRGFDPNVSSIGADAKQAGLDASAYPVARTVALGVRATL